MFYFSLLDLDCTFDNRARSTPERRLYRHSPVGLAVLLATTLTFLRLADKSLWADEIGSIIYARDWSSLQSNLSNDINAWFYYLSLHFWLSLGEHEFLVRSLSACFAIASVPLIYVLGSRLFGRRAGLLAALLLPANSFFIHYAQEARGYSLLTLLSLLSSYLFIRAVERPSWKYWAGYGVSGFLMVYTHLFGLLVLVVHLTALVFWGQRNIPWKTALISGLTILLPLLPLVFILSRSNHAGTRVNWVQTPAWADIYQLFLALAGQGRGLLLLYVTLCFMTVVSVAKLPRFKSIPPNWPRVFLFTWLLLPVAASFIVSILWKPIFVPRYLIICLPPFVLLAAAGLARLAHRWQFTLILAGLVGLAGLSLFHWYTGYQKENWRTITTFVLAEAQPGDAILFYSYFTSMPFTYYLDQAGPPDGDLTILPAPNQKLLKQLPHDHARLWLILYRNEIPPESSLFQQTLQRYYTARQKQVFTGIQVLLYERLP